MHESEYIIKYIVMHSEVQVIAVYALSDCLPNCKYSSTRLTKCRYFRAKDTLLKLNDPNWYVFVCAQYLAKGARQEKRLFDEP